MTDPRRWTPEEDARITELRQAGMLSKAIAREIGRSPGAIIRRLSMLGVRMPSETPGGKVKGKRYVTVAVRQDLYEKVQREAMRRGVRAARLLRDILEPHLG